jgi:hypothetical protein
VVIVALLTAVAAVVAFLLYRETVVGRRIGRRFARIAWRATRHLSLAVKPVAVFVLVYVEMARNGRSRT